MKQILLKKSFFIFLIVLFFSIEGFSQTTGDYRSSETGNWTTLLSWERWDGTSWVTPTVGQGWPGQNAGTGAVLIQSGHIITIETEGITTQAFGVLTINGTLVLNGINTGGTGTNFNINTSALIVTSGLTPTATINFQNKANLKLPTNTVINVSTDGLSGDCSNNQDIYIGSTVISYCHGGGGTPTFEEIMEEGGYYVLNVSPESDSSCGAKTFSFAATAFPASGSTINWYTTSTGGSAFRTSTSGADTYSPYLSATTIYYVEVSYSGYTTPRKSITATVNNTAVPTGTASQSFCASSNPTVGNLVATGTEIKWYAASSGGAVLATNTVLTNGTHYYATQTISGCESSLRFDVTVTVNNSTAGLTSSDTDNTFCAGTSVTFTATGGTSYDFRVNGLSVQSGTTSTYTTTSLTNGQVVSVVTNVSGCSSTSSGIINTVNTLPTAGLTSNDADNTFCLGTSVTFTATGGTSYDFKVNGSSVQSGVSSTYTTASLTNGQIVTVVVTNASGCSSTSSGITNTVNALPLAPTAGTPTNPNCIVPTGSVPLSGLPTSGTIIQTGYRDDTIEITAADGGVRTIGGLLPGTYYFAVSNGGCTSATVSVVIIAPDTNTWSNGAWSNGIPTINQRLFFASNYPNTNDVDIEGCSCQVTGSTAVTIKSGRTLKIENGVEVQPNATLTFENNASLVQINDDAVNSGSINYNRHTGYVKRYDFTYWSSPVEGQTMKALSPNTLYDKYYSYNPNTGWVISYNGAATMVKGNGYIIRAPQTFSVTVAAIDTNPVFIGPPNNGVVTLASLAGNKVHLLGNPYPSAIDADAFLDANSSVLAGTLYFWTHNTLPSKDIAGNAIYNYTTNDYVTYNKTGGVNFAGKIAAGQGFFAPASATGGTVVFNNSMRLGAGEVLLDNSQFFKLSNTSKATAKTTVTEKSRVWLNLTNKEGAFKQTLVGYISGATNDYDGGFDGMSYDGNQFVDFYSVNNKVNLAIQGRALPFVKQDSVVLGYKSTILGEFQISIDHTDGALSSQNIFLEDKNLQVLHDLKKAPYTFSTEKGTFKNRFILRYIDKNAVEEVIVPGISEEILNKDVLVSVQDGKITINSTDALLNQIIVYDITGRIVYQENEIAKNVFVIPHLISSQQLLLVDVLLSNGTKSSTKIIH